MEAPYMKETRPEANSWIWASPLFYRNGAATSSLEVIRWWESRRLPFNGIVGAAGIVSWLVSVIVGAVSATYFDSDYGLPGSPGLAIMGAFAYGIMANVFFTGGWIAELIVRRISPEKANRFAVRSFTIGLRFSVLLTLLPGIVIALGGIVALVGRLFGFVPHPPSN